jgi:macrolide transport system ATP-binding/permease protein
MRQLRAFYARLAGLLANEKHDQELNDELEGHLQLHIDDNLRAGMTPETARREAILKLGGLEPTKQAYRERRSVPLLEHFAQDLRFTVRQLAKNPGFTATAIFMLALGLCASVSIFAFVDAALIKALPYQDPPTLMGVYESAKGCPHCPLSYPDYQDFKKLNRGFRSLDIYQHNGMALSTPSGPQPVRGSRVSDGFFRTLGVTPALGRDFRPGEDLRGAPRTVLLSDAAWAQRFGGKADVLGKTVTLDGEAATIIGVLPRGFHFSPSEPSDFWIPLQAASECDLRRSCHGIEGIARLKPGVSTQAALADMNAIAQRLEKQYPGSNQGQSANVVPLTEVIVGGIRPILLVLLGGAALLLLIACVNIASLLLVRSESRRREMSVRSALGASRARLVGQFVTEGLVLVAAGSALGLGAAYWAMQFLVKLIPPDILASMPYLAGLGMNFRVLTCAGAIALLAAVLFAVTPALRLAAPQLRESLAEGSRGSAGNVWRRAGSKLVVLELATAMVLLVGAGLLGKSFYRLLHVDLGLQSDHLATLAIAAPKAGYAKEEQAVALGRQIVSRAASLPGVKSAALCTLLPVSYNGNTDWIRFVGKPYHGEHNDVNEREVTAAYFTTLQARLLRGRYFTDAEDKSKPLVVIINQALAKQYFPGEDPVGKQIGNDDLDPKTIKQIIGIVEDIHEGALDQAIYPAVYYPFNQNPDYNFSVVVRTSQTEQAVLPMLTAAVHQIDSGIIAFGGASMSERIESSPTAYLHRSSAWLVGGFAAMALLLGIVGLYGVVSYSVSQRTREIGVRMALGAEQGNVCRLILKEAGWLSVLGIAIGMVCAVGAAGLMRKLLFGISTWDLPTLGCVAVLLGVSALLASYVPARRAASVNPVEALRAE